MFSSGPFEHAPRRLLRQHLCATREGKAKGARGSQFSGSNGSSGAISSATNSGINSGIGSGIGSGGRGQHG